MIHNTSRLFQNAIIIWLIQPITKRARVSAANSSSDTLKISKDGSVDFVGWDVVGPLSSTSYYTFKIAFNHKNLSDTY